ncbi:MULTISPECIES: relaxase/mobilization nuclease domain-containing protein [Pseudomonas putida group]|uniref:relaxase/mobilization nuclease domain-containing protein n=1 Tax=Pseudomonas putida group TaxID=136845 RepID=UPI0018B09BBA|nr:relaxase/mobilization nuclease domain-containing protein [Pseudomonas putida]
MIAAHSELKSAILDEFEEFAFAGVDGDSRNYLAVEHMHMGRLEIHYLIPRTHAATGLYFNPFPPGYQRANDAFIDCMSLRYGLVNPRSPERMRSLKVNPRDPAVAVKSQINDFILKSIEHGSISDAEGIKAVLVGAGIEILRHGADYISLGIPGRQKALRLKGELYGRGFSVGKFAGVNTDARVQRAEVSGEIERRYKEVIDKRVEFNQKRYKGGLMSGQETTWEEGATGTLREGSRDLQQAIDDFSYRLRYSGANTGAAVADCLSRDGSVDIASVMRAVGDGHSQIVMAALVMLIEAILRVFGLTMAQADQDDEAMLVVSDIVRSVMAEVEQERNCRVGVGYGLYNNNSEVSCEYSNEANAPVENPYAGAYRVESEYPGI